MGARRWLVPLLAAVAVLAVVGAAWAFRPGSGMDEAGFAGSGGGSSSGSGGGQGSPPYAGVSPGDPGLEPASPGVDPGSPGEPGSPGGGSAEPGSIAVDSFYAYDATHLALNYYNGVPECYGEAGTPQVRETADAVVVTIPRTPVKADGDRACIDIAVAGSVDVTLSAPLDGRKVLDGSRDGFAVPEAASPMDSDQAN